MLLIMTFIFMVLYHQLVSFVVDIPTSSKDSFQGKACVALKDKVSQPSSALRHLSELLNILENETYKPILIIISDGGSDHRITFPSVKLSLIALFHALNLDMLISVCTGPYQSCMDKSGKKGYVNS